MSEEIYYNHEFYVKNNLLKDGTGYTLKIISSLNIGKIHLVIYRRDNKNKRIDMAEFYFDYQQFLAILNVLNSAFRNGKSYKLELTGGDEGKRKLYINLNVDKESGVSLGFKLIDGILPEKDIKFKDYTGKLGFIVRNIIDIVEFFELEKTIRAWELANIKKIVDQGFKPEKK